VTAGEFRALRERCYRDAVDSVILGATFTLGGLMWPPLFGAAATFFFVTGVTVLRFVRYDRMMRRKK